MKMSDVRDIRLMPACRRTPGAARGASSVLAERLTVVLGRRLRRLRVARGWSRRVVATRLRVPVAHVEGHERGTRQIEAHELLLYVRLFGVRISDLFRDPPTEGSG
jgi:ribosome-binding protein aMBF1 (putative translation factor)